MRQAVNYIEHQRAVYFKLSEDNTLTSIHVSLYMALFMIWNECGFDTELSINRNDVMKLAKIGNANTYTKSLKMLDELGYIKYKPSFNPLIGSKVTMCIFGKGSDKGTAHGTVKGGSKGSGEGDDTLYKQLNNKTKKTPKPILPEVKKLRVDCKAYFINHYQSLTGTEYYWEAKDATNLIKLLDKIKFKTKEKFPDADEEKIKEGFELVVKSITDQWLLSNFSISNINSKFNEIFTQIKSKQNGTSKVEKGQSVFN